MISKQMQSLISMIPKAENHYHLDSISPELAWRFAQRNHVDMPFHSLSEAKEFYKFHTLEQFISVLNIAISTILTEQDFEDIMVACGEDMARQHIIYREAMFDYTAVIGSRGVSLETMMRGLASGIRIARETYGADIRLIANLDRTASTEDNCRYLRRLEAYRANLPIIAVGLDMMEQGYPAHMQAETFQLAREMGYFTTAHAGEDCGAESVRDAWESLHLDRIDHGIRAVEDTELMRQLKEKQILLTLCPDSNICLGVYKDWEEYPLRRLLEHGVKISLNSDDPPCFRHDLIGNIEMAAEHFALTEDELIELLRNAFQYNFAGQEYLERFDRWVKENQNL